MLPWGLVVPVTEAGNIGCCLSRAAPSSLWPRALPPGRPCHWGSGRPCGCGAPGDLARQRVAAGTSPPTPPTPASHSRSPRAPAHAASASPCSRIARTASATPSASTSSRLASHAGWGPGARAGVRPGGLQGGEGRSGSVSTQMARSGAEAWILSFGQVGQAGWAHQDFSRMHTVCNSLGSEVSSAHCPLTLALNNCVMRAVLPPRRHLPPRRPTGMHWGTVMHQEPPQSHRTHLSPATEAAPRLGARKKQWLGAGGAEKGWGRPTLTKTLGA